MASKQPVPDEAAWREPKSPGEIGPGNDVLGSQTRKWLMQRLRICRKFALFSANSRPNRQAGRGILWTCKALRAPAVNDD
jgi:hypothetical protein